MKQETTEATEAQSRKEYDAGYYEDNRDKRKAQFKQNYKDNKEKRKKKSRNRYYTKLRKVK